MARVSDEAVTKATGRGFDAWFELLDEHAGRELDHKDIVRVLADHDVSSWWCQSITVEYEKAIGRRVAGETADSGFQVGVQRTVDASPDAVWERLTGEGLGAWLPGVASLPDEPGETVSGDEGLEVELRSIDPGRKLRMRVRGESDIPPSTVQLTLIESGVRTAINFHHEGLPDSAAREQMRAHWKAVLDELETSF